MRVAMLLTTMVMACATASRCPYFEFSSVDRPFVWEVQGPRGTLIVQATHQGASPRDASPAAWTELDRARIYITEAEEIPEAARSHPSFQAALLLPPPLSLPALIGEPSFGALVDHLEADREHVARMKPWVALVALFAAAYDVPAETLDAALQRRARERRLRVVALETWESQVAYLEAAVTPAKLRHAIRDFRGMHCNVRRRLAAFRAGNDRVFVNELRPDELHVHARIDRWLRALRYHLVRRDGRAFVAVGIGQLVGPHGLLARLAADGHRVRRL